MFAFLNKNNKTVELMYDDIIAKSRNPVLYSDYGVPDSPQGRFQMIALHAAPLMLSIPHKQAQTLFDRIFRDIELSFREIGVGDLAVPKKMKKYMQHFNGLIQAHAKADADHAAITRRNVFGDDGDMSPDFEHYIKELFQ